MQMKNKNEQDGPIMYMPVFMSIGISVGVGIGAAMGNIPIGMCIGMSVGLCIGMVLDAQNRKKSKGNPDNTPSEETSTHKDN